MFTVGNVEFKVLHTPGHTPEHISFILTDKGGGSTEPMGILQVTSFSSVTSVARTYLKRQQELLVQQMLALVKCSNR